jgi:hypothetical protein
MEAKDNTKFRLTEWQQSQSIELLQELRQKRIALANRAERSQSNQAEVQLGNDTTGKKKLADMRSRGGRTRSRSATG